MKKPSSEFQRFDALMRKIARVSHTELKAKLDEMKNNKKRKKTKVSPASGPA
jgi:DNA-binding HxlR family transcriptional regulator